MGIDVLFAGLMLICLNGESDCTAKALGLQDYGYANTAWVVKANGMDTCGWKTREKTDLTMKFLTNDFKRLNHCATDGNYTVCDLPKGNICLFPDYDQSSPGASLRSLPRLDEIDQRLLGSNKKYLDDYNYVPTRIHFPGKSFAAGLTWTSSGKSVRWYRSDGGINQDIPRLLSDRLSVSYGKANKLTVSNCQGKDLIVLERIANRAEVVLQNYSKEPPEFYPYGGYDVLTYLLWYYRLGEWDTYDGECPQYTDTAKKDAVLLRCVRKMNNSCAHPDADTTFWPAMLGPRYRQE